MLYRLVWYILTDVSEVLTASIMRANTIRLHGFVLLHKENAVTGRQMLNTVGINQFK
jgi:hypothetical protein